MNVSTLNSHLSEHRAARAPDINDLLAKYPIKDNIQIFDEQILRGVDVSRRAFLQKASNEKKVRASVKISKKSVDAMYVGGSVGAVIGGLGGGIIGGVVSGPAGGFIGVAAGIPTGFALGVAVGAAAGATKAYIEIVYDKDYLEWKRVAIENESYHTYRAYLQVHMPHIDDFICPISNDFPLVPCRSPNRHIYDASHIINHLDRKDAEWKALHAQLIQQAVPIYRIEERRREFESTICPMRGPKFTKADLLYDGLFVATMRQAVSQFLNNHNQAPPEVIHALNEFIRGFNDINGRINARQVLQVIDRMDQLRIRNPMQREAILAQVM